MSVRICRCEIMSGQRQLHVSRREAIVQVNRPLGDVVAENYKRHRRHPWKLPSVQLKVVSSAVTSTSAAPNGIANRIPSPCRIFDLADDMCTAFSEGFVEGHRLAADDSGATDFHDVS